MNVSLSKLYTELARRREVLVCSHVRPDPDGIGSMVGMAELLRAAGVKVHLRCDTPVAHSFKFIDANDEIRPIDPKRDASMLARIDGLLVCDVGKIDRLPAVWAAVTAAEHAERPVFKAALDHHHEPDRRFDALHCDPRASSSCELVWNLFRGRKLRPSKIAAQAIYAGIHFDSGGFVYERTTPATHRAAAELLAAGVDPYDILRRLYWQKTRGEFLTLAHLANHMEFHAGGRMSLVTLDKKLQKARKVKLEDLSGASDAGLTIAGVDFSLLLYEIGPMETKVSFRSKGILPVLPLAKKYGGGGHQFACGATLRLPLAKAREVLLRDAKRELARLKSK